MFEPVTVVVENLGICKMSAIARMIAKTRRLISCFTPRIHSAEKIAVGKAIAAMIYARKT